MPGKLRRFTDSRQGGWKKMADTALEMGRAGIPAIGLKSQVPEVGRGKKELAKYRRKNHALVGYGTQLLQQDRTKRI